jgi:hypothetical protein
VLATVGMACTILGTGGGSIRANTECIFEVLLQKSDHVERFVDYASKPRLMQRFNERLSEYKQCVAFFVCLSALETRDRDTMMHFCRCRHRAITCSKLLSEFDDERAQRRS